MLNFKIFVQKLEVVDCKPFECWFTWTNRRLGLDNIAKHLNRFLIGSYWLEEKSMIFAITLPYSIFDHYPIQLDIGAEIQGGSGYFKFQNMWWRNATIFYNLVKWWSQCKYIKRTPNFCLIKKIA
ncbi:hypothetical protein SUGI_0960580 [Cryptomeria japonica]|nr:hypothetical protein SUGI_0960580 [Cryptomeria japonica]